MPPVTRAGRVPGGIPKFLAQTSAPGLPPVLGALGLTVANNTLVAVGGPVATGTLARTEAGDTLASAGTVVTPGGPPPVTVVWGDAGPHIILSNGNLDAGNTVADGEHDTVRATVPHTAGKWYCEIELLPAGSNFFRAAFGVMDDIIPSSTFTYMYPPNGGATRTDGVSFGNFTDSSNGNVYLPTANVGDRIQIAVDCDHQEVYLGSNNVWCFGGVGGSDPVARLNPRFTWTSSPGINIYPTAHINSDNIVRIHPDAATQTYAPPTGYQPWNVGDTVSNRKLIRTYSPGTPRNDYGFMVGMVFRPATALTFNRVGMRYASGNSQTHHVILQNATTNTEIGSWDFDFSSGGTDGVFIYKDITPITLVVGNDYGLLAQEYTGGDYWADSGATSLRGAERYLTYSSYTWNSAIGSLTNNAADQQYVGLDLDYAVATGPTVGTLNLTQGSQTLSATAYNYAPLTATLSITQANQTLVGTGQPPPLHGDLGGSTTPISIAGGATPPGTVLLLHADGANGSTTFVDNSPSAHTLTVVGPAQVSTVAAKFGTGGLDTSASGGFGTAGINTNNATDFNFGAGQFTIEAWCYVTVPFGSNNYAILAQWGGGGSLGFYFNVSSNAIRFVYSTTGSNAFTTFCSYTFPLNTWVHIAVDRDASNNIRIYVNGAVQSTTAAAATIFPSTTNATIGNDIFNESFGGYLDEVLVMKGYAKYAGAFTPPTAPYGSTASPSCVLLCHADYDGVSSAHAYDSSPSAHILTVVAAAAQTGPHQFGNGSLYFPFSSSYVDTGNATDFQFGAGPFTIEAWAFFTAQSPSGYVMSQYQFGGGGSGNQGWQFVAGNGAITVNLSTDGNSLTQVSGAYTFTNNVWYHLAVDRDASGVVRLYVNGVVVTSGTVASALYPSTLPATIGNSNTGSNSFQGYLDEVRVTKGRAMYAGAFTPQLAPFVASNTVLLCHADYDGVDSFKFYDSSLSANLLTSVNSAFCSGLAKFGSGAAGFLSSNSYIDTNNTTDFNFGAGPFTVEAWAYFASNPAGVWRPVAAQWGGGTAVGWVFGIGNDDNLEFALYDGSVTRFAYGAYTPTLNTWIHLAVDRDVSGVTRVYADGAVIGSNTITNTANPTTANAQIGNYSGNVTPFPGYLDEVRITKGVARFAGAFTPPTQAYAGDSVATTGLTQANQTLSAAGTVAAAGAITGALNLTQANQTLAATGTVLVTGTLGVTEALDTIVAAGGPRVGATLAATQANQTLGSAGAVQVRGTLGVTEALDTIVAAAALGPVTGTLNLSQAPHTLLATGVDITAGALNLSQAPHTLVAAGVLPITGALNQPQASQTLAATGGPVARGTLSATQANHTLVAAGTVGVSGTLNQTQANHTLGSAGAVQVRGTLNVSEAGDTLAATGNVTALTINGTLNRTQADQTLVAAGGATVRGTLAATQVNQTLVGIAVVGDTAALSLTQANQTLVATGTITVGGALSLIQADQTLTANANVAALVQTRVVIMA